MRKIFVTILFLLFAATTPLPASAHVLKTDGDIGAIVHIDPADDPIVGQAATFLFEFKDKAAKFDFANCDCTISIANRGQEIKKDILTTPSYQYVFPEKSLYTVAVSGRPKQESVFQSFTLSYDIRVDRGNDIGQPVQPKTDHTAHYIIFGGGFLALLILYIIERRKKNIGGKTNRQKNITGLCAAVALTGLLFHHSITLITDACHDMSTMANQTHDLACCNVPPVIASEKIDGFSTFTTFSQPFKIFFSFQSESAIFGLNKSPPLYS